jgi:ankyrin repeat protein
MLCLSSPSLVLAVRIQSSMNDVVLFQSNKQGFVNAANDGHLDAIQRRLAERFDKDWQDDDGNTTLMVVSGKRHVDIVRLMVDRCAQLDLPWHPIQMDLQDQYGQTALILACGYGHPQIVRLLVDRGAQLDLQENDGTTALMLAIDNGHLNLARL